MAPIGTPSRYRGGQRHVDRIGWVTVKLQCCKVFGLVRIGQPVDFGLPAQSRKSDRTMMQRQTAALDQVAGVRFGAA